MIVLRRKSSNTLESPPPAAPRSYRKPQADLYTILLVMALVAVLVTILFMYLYMKIYAQAGNPPPVVMDIHQLSLLASASFPGL
jgi:hypothetical protein